MTTRSRLLSLAAIATLALAACGGSTATATPEPTGTPAAATDSPAPSVAAPTVAPASASPAAEGPDIEGATTALDSIQKYHLALTMSGMIPTASGAGQITMTGLVDQEADAYEFEMTGFEMPGLPATGINFVVIGPDAWIDLGTGTYLKQPGGASSFDQMRAGLAPATLLGQFPTTGLDLLKVADEEKNGVATTHYHASAADTPGLAAQIGPDGVMDFWLATDGGYLVSMTMNGTMDVSGTATPVVMSIDLSRINDDSINIVAPN
jgi:hypothetical protein